MEREREKEINTAQCQIDIYHKMTKIYIYIRFIILIKFANMFLFISLIPKIHSRYKPTDIEPVIFRYINTLVLYKYRASHK